MSVITVIILLLLSLVVFGAKGLILDVNSKYHRIRIRIHQRQRH